MVNKSTDSKAVLMAIWGLIAVSHRGGILDVKAVEEEDMVYANVNYWLEGKSPFDTVMVINLEDRTMSVHDNSQVAGVPNADQIELIEEIFPDQPAPAIYEFTQFDAVMTAEGVFETDDKDYYLAAWQYLVDHDALRGLQGFFGRTAHSLIEGGHIVHKNTMHNRKYYTRQQLLRG
jgi:hypothetical protein